MRKRMALGFMGIGFLAVAASQIRKELLTPATTQKPSVIWFGRVLAHASSLRSVLTKDKLLSDPKYIVIIRTEAQKLLQLLNDPALQIDATTRAFLISSRTNCQAILNSLYSEEEVKVRSAIGNLNYEVDKLWIYLSENNKF